MTDKFLPMGLGSSSKVFRQIGADTFAEVVVLASGGVSKVVITGEYKFGKTLTASPAPGWSWAAGKWVRDGVDIAGATSLTYTQGLADIGKDIAFVPTSPVEVSAAGRTTADVPGAPTIGTATAGDGTLSLNGTAPASDGGAAIIGYRGTLDNGTQKTSAVLPVVFTGLQNGITRTGVVEALNAIGYGPASAASNPVTPLAAPISASDILYSEKIATMLSAMRASNTQQVDIAYIGMSNDFGAGSKGPTANDWGETEFSTLSIVPKTSAAINAARGGAFKRGIEVVGGFSDSSPLNPFFTLGGGAALIAKYGAAAGPSGMAVSLIGGGTTTMSFTVTAGSAGQKVKIYGYTTGGVGGIVPRYSLSGANVQATANLPASTTAAPVAGLPYYWYETTLTLASAGNTTVTLLAPAASGASLVVWGVDPDLRQTPGLTMHRLCKAGEGLGTLLGVAIDDTDTQPPGVWTSNASKAAFRAAQTTSLTTRVGVSGVVISTVVNDILCYSNNAGAYGFGWLRPDLKRHLSNTLAALAAQNIPCLLIIEAIRNPNTYSVAGGTGTPYTQTDIINDYKEIAAASTNCAVLDLTKSFVGATEMDTYNNLIANLSHWLPAEATGGSGGTAYAPAYVHYSAAGHAEKGARAAAQIIAAMG